MWHPLLGFLLSSESLLHLHQLQPKGCMLAPPSGGAAVSCTSSAILSPRFGKYQKWPPAMYKLYTIANIKDFIFFSTIFDIFCLGARAVADPISLTKLEPVMLIFCNFSYKISIVLVLSKKFHHKLKNAFNFD